MVAKQGVIHQCDCSSLQMAALGKRESQQQQDQHQDAQQDGKQSSLFQSTAHSKPAARSRPAAAEATPLSLSPTSPLTGPADAAPVTSSDSSDGVFSSPSGASGRRAADAGGSSRGASPVVALRVDDAAPPSPDGGYRTPPRGSSPDRADVRARRPLVMPSADDGAAVRSASRCA